MEYDRRTCFSGSCLEQARLWMSSNKSFSLQVSKLQKVNRLFVRVFANFSGSVIRFADQELVRRQEILPDVYLK